MHHPNQHIDQATPVAFIIAKDAPATTLDSVVEGYNRKGFRAQHFVALSLVSAIAGGVNLVLMQPSTELPADVKTAVQGYGDTKGGNVFAHVPTTIPDVPKQIGFLEMSDDNGTAKAEVVMNDVGRALSLVRDRHDQRSEVYFAGFGGAKRIVYAYMNGGTLLRLDGVESIRSIDTRKGSKLFALVREDDGRKVVKTFNTWDIQGETKKSAKAVFEQITDINSWTPLSMVETHGRTRAIALTRVRANGRGDLTIGVNFFDPDAAPNKRVTVRVLSHNATKKVVDSWTPAKATPIIIGHMSDTDKVIAFGEDDGQLVLSTKTADALKKSGSPLAALAA